MSSSVRLDAKTLIEKMDEALSYGLPLFTPKDILERVADGRFQLWLKGESFIVTSIEQFPQAKTCFVRLVGGKLEEILEMEKDLSEWSQAEECDYIWGQGREPWKDALAEHGYSLAAVMLAKPLNSIH